MLFTTYKLALESGLETDCPLFRSAVAAFGPPVVYGETRPLSIPLLLSRVGLKAALWALRAVYPESLFAARSLARKVALEASSEATGRYPEHKAIEAARMSVVAYLEGVGSLEDMGSHRVKIAPIASRLRGPEQAYAYATLAALAPKPERLTLSAYENGIRSLAGWNTEESNGFEKAKDFSQYLSDYLADEWGGTDQIGPGEITEPSGKGRPRKDGLPSGSPRSPESYHRKRKPFLFGKSQLRLSLEGL